MSKGFVWFTNGSETEKGLRLGSVGMEQSSSFLWVKRHVKEGSGNGHLSP
jgi:hypothetical protein